MNTVNSIDYYFTVNETTPESCKDNERLAVWAAGPTTDPEEEKVGGSAFSFYYKDWQSIGPKIAFNFNGADMLAIEGRYFADTRVAQIVPDENRELDDLKF